MVGDDFNEDFIGWIAIGCYLIGFSILLMSSCGCGDHEQTSIKTITLMSLATVLAIPSIYGMSIVDYILYSLNILMVLIFLYLRFIQKDSSLKTTYNKQLDNFSHWLLCFLPAVGIFICIFLFFDTSGDNDINGSFTMCKNEFYPDNVTYCIFLSFHLFSSTLYMMAFIPQVYVVFKIWAGHAQERIVYTKIKMFLMIMFASFCLRSLWWYFWTAFNQALQSDIFIVFCSINAITAIITIIPWLIRATFMQCFPNFITYACCIAKPQRDEPGANSQIRVNTGQSNEMNAMEEAEEEKMKKKQTSSSWLSYFSKKETSSMTLNENEPPEEERNVGVILPEGINSSSSTGWQQQRSPMSSSNVGGRSSTNTGCYASPTVAVVTPSSSVATSPSTYYSGSGAGFNDSPPPAASGGGGGGNDRPDWLREE